MKKFFFNLIKILRANFQNVPQDIINVILIFAFVVIIIGFLNNFFAFLSVLLLSYFIFAVRTPLRIVTAKDFELIAPRDGAIEKITDSVPPKESGINEKMQRIKISSGFVATNFILSPQTLRISKISTFANEMFSSNKNIDGSFIVFDIPNDKNSKIVMLLNYGFLSRKNIFLIKENQDVEIGRVIAYSLVLGSVELFLPYEFELKCKMNQTLVAGETIIAKKSPSSAKKQEAKLPAKKLN
jgi:phosphatidylserine decarboxylase